MITQKSPGWKLPGDFFIIYHIIHGIIGDNYIVPHNRVNYNIFPKNLYLSVKGWLLSGCCTNSSRLLTETPCNCPGT